LLTKGKSGELMNFMHYFFTLGAYLVHARYSFGSRQARKGAKTQREITMQGFCFSQRTQRSGGFPEGVSVLQNGMSPMVIFDGPGELHVQQLVTSMLSGL